MPIRRGLRIGVIIASTLFLYFLFFRTYDYHVEILRLNKEMISLEERMSVKAGNWVQYAESRVNRLAQTQDEYQWSTSKRIDYLSDRITKLEKRIRELEQKEGIQIPE